MLHEMLDKGYTLNVITYTILNNGLCKEGKLKQALRLLNVMVQIDHWPIEITYNEFINGFCKVANMENTKEIL